MPAVSGHGVHGENFEKSCFFDGIFFDFEDEVPMDAVELEP